MEDAIWYAVPWGPAWLLGRVEAIDAIWQEMPNVPGYLGHVLIEDLDDPGHLFVVSEWESREAADKVLAEYASAQTHAWRTSSSPSRAGARSDEAWDGEMTGK